MSELAGKRAIVTGGTRGIGFATVQALAKAGAEVIFTGSSQASVDAAMQRLDQPGNIAGIACDVRDESGMHELLAGGCDILINNAAIAEPSALLHEASSDALRDMIEITLFAALQWARHAAADMIARGGGTIINVSSGSAHFAAPNMGPYCIAKAGMVMATKTLHLETADAGVRVFGLRPGVVDTDMQTAARESGKFAGILPSDRSELSQPEEPAYAIRWLCSHGDAFAGQDIIIGADDFQKAMAASPLA